MPIFIDGKQFEDEASVEAAFNPVIPPSLKRVYIRPPSEDGVVRPDEGIDDNVRTPGQVWQNQQMDKFETSQDNPLGGIEIGFKTPLEATEKPADALKPEERTEVRPEPYGLNPPIREMGFWKALGIERPPEDPEAGKVVIKTKNPLTDITKGDIDRGIEAAMSAGPGTLGKPKPITGQSTAAQIMENEKAFFKTFGFDIDPTKLSKKQYTELQHEIAKFNNWDTSERDFFRTLKEHQDYTKAGGYLGVDKAFPEVGNIPEGWYVKQPKLTKENTPDNMFEQIPYAELENRDYGAYKLKQDTPVKTIWKGPEGEIVKWKDDSLNSVDFYYNSGGYSSMSPSDAVHKMKSSKGDIDVAKAMDEIENILNFWDRESSVAKGKKIPITEKGSLEPTWMPEPPADVEKLSPKEAFKRGAEEIAQKLNLAFANIRSKFMTAIKEPKMEMSDFVIPEKAKEKGYTTPAFRGLRVYEGNTLNPVQKFNYDETRLYSSASPMLADMYSSYLNTHPGYLPVEGAFQEGAQVMPLLINTKDYLYYNAKGGHWASENPKAMEKALKEGKKGVIVDNVWDEPNSTHTLTPKKIFITFPSGASTVKSRFAEKFDETSKNMLHTIGIGGPAGYIAVNEFRTNSESE